MAAEWAGFTTIGQCEIDDYCTQLLEKNFPGVPRWRDIRDVTRESVSARGIGRIDLLSGGIPCQPHSVAGKRGGSTDERDLWPQFARLIRELRPIWVLVENVPGLLSSDSGRFFGRILRDLAEMGYDAVWCVYGANAIGAPHRRERLLIVGNSSKCGLSGESWGRAGQVAKNGYIQPENGVMADTKGVNARGLPIGKRAQKSRFTLSGQNVADTTSGRLSQPQYKPWSTRHIEATAPKRTFFTDQSSWSTQSRLGGMPGRSADWLDCHRWPAGPGEPQHEWEPPRVAKGVKHRVQRLKALGNICMPHQVYPILQAIADIEGEKRGRGEIGKTSLVEVVHGDNR